MAEEELRENSDRWGEKKEQVRWPAGIGGCVTAARPPLAVGQCDATLILVSKTTDSRVVVPRISGHHHPRISAGAIANQISVSMVKHFLDCFGARRNCTVGRDRRYTPCAALGEPR